VGLATVTQAGLDDPTQFDPNHKYFDPKSSPTNPRWQTVEVGYERTFKELISLDRLREAFTPEEFAVVRPGNRLSVMPVADAIAERLLLLASK
jgi:predicted RNA-binding protein with PUA-like domain